MWSDVGHSISQEYSDLETRVISSGASSCRYYILKNGFKDIGNSLVFGEVQWGTPEEIQNCFEQLEIIAQKKQLHQIIGPLDFSTYFNYRLRLDFFQEAPFMGEPDNPPEAVKILKHLGYKIEKKFNSHEFRVRWNFKFMVSVVVLGLWARLKSHQQIQMVKLSEWNYSQYLLEIYQLTDEVFSSHYLYQKIPFESFRYLFQKKLLPNIDSETSIVALNKETQILVGYSLCLKDENNSKRLLFKTIGVKKEYRQSSYVGRQLMLEVYLAARKKYKTCMACLMIEGNRPEILFRRNSFFTKSYGLFAKKMKSPSISN